MSLFPLLMVHFSAWSRVAFLERRVERLHRLLRPCVSPRDVFLGERCPHARGACRGPGHPSASCPSAALFSASRALLVD